MSRRSRRRGLTVIELLVAAAIGALAVTAIYYLFRQSRGSAVAAEDRLSTLSQARVLVDLLKRDVACLTLAGKSEAEAVRSGGGRLAFPRVYRVDDGGAQAETVEWTYDANAKLVGREFKGEKRVFGGGPILVTKFAVERREQGIGARRIFWFDVAFTMRKDQGDDRSEITFRERLHPPVFDGAGPRWNP